MPLLYIKRTPIKEISSIAPYQRRKTLDGNDVVLLLVVDRFYLELDFPADKRF